MILPSFLHTNNIQWPLIKGMDGHGAVGLPPLCRPAKSLSPSSLKIISVVVSSSSVSKIWVIDNCDSGTQTTTF